jgi:hypothetical protein
VARQLQSLVRPACAVPHRPFGAECEVTRGRRRVLPANLTQCVKEPKDIRQGRRRGRLDPWTKPTRAASRAMHRRRIVRELEGSTT